MSELLRIALVAEGPTDTIVIEAALRAILAERPFLLKQLQPEGSLVFGLLGGGWGGIYRWCKQSASRGMGRLSADALLFAAYDLLIIHVDADVASATYQAANVVPCAGDGPIPCAEPCPPARATTDRLRMTVLSWCGEDLLPARVVLCTPAQSIEAWVLSAVFPADAQFQKHGECLFAPEERLAAQPKAQRMRKAQRDYRRRAEFFTRHWATMAELEEAARFESELRAAISAR